MNVYPLSRFGNVNALKSFTYCFAVACTIVFCKTADAQEKKVSEPEILGMFYHLNTEINSLTPLDKQSVKIKSRGFLTSTGYFEVKGEKSSLRLKNTQPLEFVASFANGIDPNKFMLYPLTIRKKNREAILGKATVKGSEVGAEAIPLTVKKYGESSYKFTLPATLTVGEFSITAVKLESIFSEDAKEVFCFGIDKENQKLEDKEDNL